MIAPASSFVSAPDATAPEPPTAGQGRVRRGDLSKLAVGYGAAAAVVVAVRLLEPSARVSADGVVFAPNVASNAPTLGLLAALAVVVGAFVGSRVRARPLAWATTAALGSFVGLAVVARATLPWWLTGWLVAEHGARITGDLLAFAAAGTAAVAALALAERRWARRAVVVGGVALALALALVPVSDLVVRAGLGTQGVYFALKDFALNPGQLLPMLVADGPTGPAIAGLAALAAVGAAVAAVGRGDRGRVPLSDAAAPFVIAALALGVGTAASGHPTESSLVRFGRMALADLQYATSGVEGDGSAFDLRGAALAAPAADRPNVVVLVLESVGSRAVGAYGDLPTTPFLDSLARAGVLVEDLSTTTPYTNKALVSIFGGVPPSPATDVIEAEPGAVPSPGLPALLAPLGYRSAFFTPARLSFERKDRVLANLGFEEVWGDGAYHTAGFEETNHFGFEDRVVLDRALGWVEARADAGEPFFLGLLTLTAHHPYTVPEGAERLGLGEGPWGDYLDTVRYTDAFVRDVVAGVERLGLLDETAFIIVGDHGEGFGEHEQYNHGNVIYEEALRVPGIVFAPGLAAVEPGRVVRGPHQIIDVAPTVAALVGAEWVGAPPPGQSLLADAPAERPLFFSCKSVTACQAVRVGTRKYIYRHGYAPTEVYDLSADPGETEDLAAATAREAVRVREGQIAAWTRSVRAAYAAGTPARQTSAPE